MVLGKLPVPRSPTIWIIVGQGPTALAVGAGGGCLDFFSLVFHFSFLTPSLWETARYRLKYCLKGPLSPNQPTNQIQTTPTRTYWKRSRPFPTLIQISRTPRHWKLTQHHRGNTRKRQNYSRLSLSLLRLSQITAYLEEKIGSLKHIRCQNIVDKRRNCCSGGFPPFPQYFQHISLTKVV